MKTKPILFFCLAGAGILNTSCEDLWNRCVEGNGDIAIQTIPTDAFDQIQVSGDFLVQVDTGMMPSVKIETDENLMNFIVVHVAGHKLLIESREGTCLRPSKALKITVNTHQLNEIALYGSGSVSCDGLETDQMNLHLEGSGKMECYGLKSSSASLHLIGDGFIRSSVITGNLTAQMDGSGEILLEGKSSLSDLSLIGSGNYNAAQLLTDTCYVYISGSGIMRTWVTKTLDITIIGSGIVYYTGNPDVTSYISGSGKIYGN
jgi:hypothetical protein